MSQTLIKIIAILLFAMAAAFLYGWGVIKSRNLEKDLYAKLYMKGVSRVKKYLGTHEYITLQDAENEVQNIKTSQFYSRKRATVQNKKEFSKSLLSSMVDKGILRADTVNGRKTYYLTGKEL